MLRSILAVVAGGATWALLFPLLAVLLTFVWPALDEAVQVYVQTDAFDVFDETAMLVTFQILWLITNAAAGIVAALIAGRLAEVRVLAVLLVAYFAFNHFWAYWQDFPPWYNLLVVALVVPAVLAGGMLPQRFGTPRGPDRAVAAGSGGLP